MKDKVAILDELMGDQNHLKRGVRGLKFKNQDLTPRITTNQAVQDPAPQQKDTGDQEKHGEYHYVASKKSKVFHKITCPHVGTIKEDNLIFFTTLEEAQKSGRRGCKQYKLEE